MYAAAGLPTSSEAGPSTSSEAGPSTSSEAWPSTSSILSDDIALEAEGRLLKQLYEAELKQSFEDEELKRRTNSLPQVDLNSDDED